MIEDFEGYNGRISVHNWECGGTRKLLAPFYKHNEIELEPEAPNTPDGFKFAKNKGAGVPAETMAGLVDEQSEHCTSL